MAKVFPEAGELGREQRRAGAPAPTPTPYSWLPSWGLELWWGDWGAGGGSLQVLSPLGHRYQGRRPPARAHFSHLRVALALGLWVWPPGASTFLCPLHLKEEAVVLMYGAQAPRPMSRL